MRHAKPQYTRSNQMRTIQHNGEFYLSSFDFFQNIQRWMYQQGLFNYFGPMQDWSVFDFKISKNLNAQTLKRKEPEACLYVIFLPLYMYKNEQIPLRFVLT